MNIKELEALKAKVRDVLLKDYIDKEVYDLDEFMEDVIIATKNSIETSSLDLEELKRLKHHEATTLGLWATDRPDLIEDPKKVMFKIK